VSNRKPPLCPMAARHQQQKLNNAVPAVHNFTNNNTIINNNTHSSYNNSHTSAATTNNQSNSHNNNNNLLQNNLVFQNNRYTFSLNRLPRYQNGNNVSGVGGSYLDSSQFVDMTLPLPTAANSSVYGDGSYIKTSRGTKSDIGVSVRKKSCHKHSHKSHSHNHERHNHATSHIMQSDTNSKSGSLSNRIQNSSNNDCYKSQNKSAYCISGKQMVNNQSDYLENYKAATHYLYLQQQQQQQQIEEAQALAEAANDGYVDEHGQNNYVYYKDFLANASMPAGLQSLTTTTAPGPLVFLDPEHCSNQMPGQLGGDRQQEIKENVSKSYINC
jgi:hypothetical protein